MPPIEVVYENGVFRPLQPVELPEGAAGAVVLADGVGAVVDSDAAPAAPDHTQKPYQSFPDDGSSPNALSVNGASGDSEDGEASGAESPGQRAYRLLMEIAALPHTSPDGRTDISVEHDSILYPTQGRMP